MQRLIDADRLKLVFEKNVVSADIFNSLIDAQPTVEAIPIEWIPITTRPMNTEERLEWEEENGFVLEDDDAWIYTSQLPDNGQEVLVCGRYGAVWIDKFMNDPAYGCWLAETGDMDGIVAWMPLPKPYGEREEDAKTS